MSAAACLKVILNQDTIGTLNAFDKFVEMGLVKDDDFRKVTGAEKRLIDVVRKVNERIVARQQ